MIDENDPEEQRANARERWEAAAPRWEDRVGGFLDGTLPLAHWMVDALAPQPGQRVLELAAGRGDVGFLAAELLQPGGELISTDGAEAMVEVARQRGEQLGLTNVEYKPMELEWVDAKLASLDGILCRHGYQHAVDPEAAFREARRVLKPGAKLVLSVWSTPEENLWLSAINTAAESLGLQEPAAPDAPGAFALSNPQRLDRPDRGRRPRRADDRADRPHLQGPIGRRLVRDPPRDVLHAATPARDPHTRRPLQVPRRRRRDLGPLHTRRRIGRDPRPQPGSRRRGGGGGLGAGEEEGARVAHRLRRPMFYDDDADLTLLDGKTVAIIGFGSQGHAHAQNLKDSGVNVVVGLREDSASVQQAKDAGLTVKSVADAASEGDVVMLLVPDELHGQVWDDEVKDGIAEGNLLLFGHGFSVLYETVEPPAGVDVALAAPKGPGHLVRRQYTEGSGVPGLIAIHQDATGKAKELALAYAKGIGCTRGGVFETTFKEETETDLFGEQAVLCGGASALVQAGFDTLVEAGYDPQMAYFECLHELKLIVDLMYEKGLSGMRYSISNTAEYGDYTRGPRVVNDDTKAEMRRILGEIQDGTFAREWIAENNAGQENFKRMRAEQADTQVEHVGKELRSHMDWIQTEF